MDGWNQRFIARFGAEKLAENQRRQQSLRKRWQEAYLIPPTEKEIQPVETQVERWVSEAKKYRLEKCVFQTGGGNEQLSKIVHMAPDVFVGMAHHDPFSEGAPEELTRAIEKLGLKGYKILAPTVERRLDDPTLDPLWKTAEKYHLPVLIHFGILGGVAGLEMQLI